MYIVNKANGRMYDVPQLAVPPRLGRWRGVHEFIMGYHAIVIDYNQFVFDGKASPARVVHLIEGRVNTLLMRRDGIIEPFHVVVVPPQ